MLREKILPFLGLLLIFSFFMQACAAPQQGDLPDLGPIRIGYLPTLGYSAFMLANEKGYYREQGLEVELTSFKSGSEMMAPLSSGQLDVGAGEPGTALFNAVAQDLDIRVVCGFSAQAPGHGSSPILVRKDLADSGEISEPGDLAGRKVGMNVPRGVVEYTISKLLSKAGLSIDDVETVTIPFPDMPAALANRAVDAALLPYPNAAKAIKDGSAVVFMGGDEIAGTIQNAVMYFGKRLLEPANREVAFRFMVATLKAIRDMQGDGWKTDENLTIINSYTKLPPEVIKSSVRSYSDPNCAIISESLKDIQDYFISRGYTEHDTPLDIEEVVDSSFRQEAIKRIGEYKP